MMKNLILIVILALSLAACNRIHPVKMERWMGKWPGPEGTYMVISEDGDHYQINIQSLDYLKTYSGKKVDDHIEFMRGNKLETIRAGKGKDTGMKWLLDKKKCLIIKPGEAFCRK